MLTTSGLFPHRMNVYRDTGQRDRFGQRDMQVFQTERGLLGMAPTAADIRCRAETPTGGGRWEERSVLVFVVNWKIFVDPNADVNEADRVHVYEPVHKGILVPDGIVMLITPVYAMDIIHHLEIQVQTVRGPQPAGVAPAGTEGVTGP